MHILFFPNTASLFPSFLALPSILNMAIPLIQSISWLLLFLIWYTLNECLTVIKIKFLYKLYSNAMKIACLYWPCNIIHYNEIYSDRRLTLIKNTYRGSEKLGFQNILQPIDKDKCNVKLTSTIFLSFSVTELKSKLLSRLLEKYKNTLLRNETRKQIFQWKFLSVNWYDKVFVNVCIRSVVILELT